jgi:hypothetical protein
VTQPPQQAQPHWDPNQQQWIYPPGAGAPAPAPVVAGPAGTGLGTHLKRAVDWNVATMVPSPREEQALHAAGVDRWLGGLFAWRRSCLLVALPILVVTAILAFVNAAQADLAGYTAFGKFIQWLPALALLFPPLGVVLVLNRWTELRRGARALIVCWGISIAVPLLAQLMPIDWLIDDTVAQSGQLFLLRITVAINSALTLLPVILTVPSGVLKGAGRIKSLFPSSAVPGWFLVAVAPFYSLFIVVVFVIFEQVLGNPLLLIGVAILAFTPWLFVIHRKVYGRPMSYEEARVELPRVSKLGGWLTLGAFVVIVLFVLTGKVDSGGAQGSLKILGSSDDVDNGAAFFGYLDALRTVAEVFGRSLLTAVVFSTIFLVLTFTEWQNIQRTSAQVRAEHDGQMYALQRYLLAHDPAAPPS